MFTVTILSTFEYKYNIITDSVPRALYTIAIPMKIDKNCYLNWSLEVVYWAATYKI